MPEDPQGTAGSPGTRAGDETGSVFQRGSPDWGSFKTSLGEMGKDKALEPIKDFHGLTKSFIDSQKMIGNSIRLPAKDMKPEDRQKAVKEIIGKLRSAEVLESIPESPEKYEIKMPEMEGFKVNESLLGSFTKSAHQFGITPSQAQGLFDWYLNFQEEADTQEQTEFENMKRDMKKELGGLYTRKMEAARRAVAKYIGQDGDDIISQVSPAIGRKLVLAFAEIGDPLLEEELMTGGLPGVVTADGIQAKINAMFNDPKSALMDISHPQHKEAVEEYSKLQKDHIRLTNKK